MYRVRASFYIFVLFIFTFFMWFFLKLTHRFLNERQNYIIASNWSNVAYTIMKLIGGLPYELKGIENVDLTKSAIYLARHESFYETLFFKTIIPNLCFVIKQELINKPIAGLGLKHALSIPIDRSQGSKSIKYLFRAIKKRLANNYSIVIFPEGTRTAHDKIGKIKRGGLAIAIKEKVPIHLVAHNSGKFWDRKGPFFKTGKVEFIFSEPQDFYKKDIAEVRAKVEDFFKQNL